MSTKLKLGLNHCSNSEYHADTEYVSSSGLKLALKSLSDFHAKYNLGRSEEHKMNQNALDEGSLAHTLILEPHMLDVEYAFYFGVKRGEKYDRFVETEARGRLVMSTAQRDRVIEWVNAYKALPVAVDLFNGGESEVTICAELEGVKVKVRLDRANAERGIIADVKTTGYSGDVEVFKQTMEGLEYDLSAALYLMVAEAYYGKPFDFYFCVLSKADKTCDIYKTSKATRLKGETKVRKALKMIKEARESGNWTDDEDYEAVPKLALQEYVIKEV